MKKIKLENQINNATINDNKATRAESIVSTTPELGGRRIAVVDTDLYDIDYSYQRVRTAHVNYLSDNFDINECDPLLVSYRDDRFFIIDGQHRYYAAVANGIKRLLCIIRTGLTAEDEARIFVKTNTSRKPLKPYDIYKANIRNGNENIPEVKIDMGVKRVCEKHNISVNKDNTLCAPRRLRALTAARRIVKTNGEVGLDWIFSTMKETNWYDCGEAYIDSMLSALNTYYTDNVNDLEKAQIKLIKIMTEYSPMELVAYAKELYSEYGRYASLTNTLKDLA